jgi:sugar phosphate isomerase/epimerase
MRIGVSSLAWNRAADEAVAALLKERGIAFIDVVPSKYLSDLNCPSREEAVGVRQWWQEWGIEIAGMQALLIGTNGLNVFGDSASRAAMLQHLDRIATIGKWLGARVLTFGSPRNRDRSGISDAIGQEMAISFFRQLGEIASGAGVIFCLEPNPADYGCNFMTTTIETVAMVRAVAHPSIRLQLDTGAIIMNGENPDAVISAVADVVGHIHLSEPNLVELGTTEAPHSQIARSIVSHGIDANATVEMKPTGEQGQNLAAIERALKFATAFYG